MVQLSLAFLDGFDMVDGHAFLEVSAAMSRELSRSIRMQADGLDEAALVRLSDQLRPVLAACAAIHPSTARASPRPHMKITITSVGDVR
jgi:hypothetical protein